MTREEDKGTTFDPDLHNMGGDIGKASIRGSNAKPGGNPRDEAAPKGGYSEPAGFMAGRDDEYGVTAGSDEKSVAARTDEIEGHIETNAGPSPHPMKPDALGPQGHGGDPAFRVQGPVDEERHGEVEDDGPKAVTRPVEDGHVGGDLTWTDFDDPDGGSGRTDSGDGGYLPGEGTGRPYRD